MADNAKVVLIGRLTREPKQTNTTNGTLVNFSVAVNTNKKEASGAYIPDYYQVSVWGKPAEFILPRLQKGSLVQVLGTQQQGEYTDSNGVKHFVMNVRAIDVTPLTGLKGKEQQDEPQEKPAPF